jgi:tRNA-dihydrouridine synthase B
LTSKTKFILAPLQGYTEKSFRSAWASVFAGIEYAVSPFIPLAEGSRYKLAHVRDVLPENNISIPVVPQILGNDPEKFVVLSHLLQDLGFETVNWNLGCPKRSIAAKKRGSGILPYPDLLRQILDRLIPKLSLTLSIKTRLGYQNPEEFYSLINVYNDFPLQSLIIHPRTGVQEYEGNMQLAILRETITEIKHPIIFSGDITDKASFGQISTLFPEINHWMLGRGILANPFLPEILLKRVQLNDENQIRQRLLHFNNELFFQISGNIGKEKFILNKMKDFWSYFALWFANSREIFTSLAHQNDLKFFMEKTNILITEAGLSSFEGRGNKQLKT